RVYGMPEVVAVQLRLERLDLSQGWLGADHLSQSDGAIQSSNWRRGHADQYVVEDQDLRPIRCGPRRRLRMACGNRRLQLIWTGAAQRAGTLETRHGLCNHSTVPKAAILVAQEDELPFAIEASSRTRDVQTHQRQQSQHLGLQRKQSGEQLRQPHGVFSD